MEAHSEALRFEAALCIWEAMLESSPPYSPRGNMIISATIEPWQIAMAYQFEGAGSVQMRHFAIDLADKALRTFDLIGKHKVAELLDLIPYDWEFIPAFVARVDWVECTADPEAIAGDLLDRLWPANTAAERLEMAKMVSTLGYDPAAAAYEIANREATPAPMSEAAQ